MSRPSFVQRLGLAAPIVQAPIGSACTPELVAAVGEAGGLGVLAGSWLSAERLTRAIERVRELSARPFGVNLVLSQAPADHVRICVAEAVPVLSTSWGAAAGVSAALRGTGMVHVHMVGAVEDAVRAVADGVDAVVAQGWEAGGHVLGEVSTLALVPAVVDAVDVPVLAAGGIADARGVAAVTALGADAAWVGTRFLAAREADVHPDYRARLAAAGPSDTVFGEVFTGGWPDAPHRALRTSSTLRSDLPPEVVAVDGDGRPVRRYDDVIPTAGVRGDVEALAHYAGQGVGLVHGVSPAASIVAALWPGPAAPSDDGGRGSSGAAARS
ncbi:nitronate monooxygenase family protein [Pseudonocardia sp. WMMC193]|uniref:NAD(P)H-dependent flavin oxidoreductase n=1 Tax=Pseudonocardia sp. WMMC193 TaxID=2911965 RepID=UPI001F363600|nr:nitronate monooxygenase [Pseudonocardia sp. WMMC193]MCF7548196.1 nitronate monooxygenase [Pseudonocardia sp. WMMC193]